MDKEITKEGRSLGYGGGRLVKVIVEEMIRRGDAGDEKALIRLDKFREFLKKFRTVEGSNCGYEGGRLVKAIVEQLIIESDADNKEALICLDKFREVIDFRTVRFIEYPEEGYRWLFSNSGWTWEQPIWLDPPVVKPIIYTNMKV